MPTPLIDLRTQVEAKKSSSLAAAQAAMDSLLTWTADPALDLPLHRVEAKLSVQLMKLGMLLLSVWLAHRLPTEVPASFQKGRGWYQFNGFSTEPIRSRFGAFYASRPEFMLVDGHGPFKLAPFDRAVGLAAGRMSLGVHLIVAKLVAKLPFQGVHDIMTLFGGYVPATRSMHGIVDKLGPVAATHMQELPAPDDDGEILVIEIDHKGAPHMGPAEHQQRRKKHKKQARGVPKSEQRRVRRRRKHRERKAVGDKSKNARMAAIGVVYTLHRRADGQVETSINRRVFGTFKGTEALFAIVKQEAVKRGYGDKETIFLADGERKLWRLQGKYFPKATPCLDWYHLSEYLWTAGASTYKSSSKAHKAKVAEWVKARQAELRDNKIDEVLAALTKAHQSISTSGPGTKTRRKNVASAITYITNHRDFMPYKELIARDLVIGTGSIEGVAKYVGARLDGSGMRWSKERSEHVLALRCVMASQEWDGFAEAAARAHEQRADWLVERVTPDKVQTPHKAKKKAA